GINLFLPSPLRGRGAGGEGEELPATGTSNSQRRSCPPPPPPPPPPGGGGGASGAARRRPARRRVLGVPAPPRPPPPPARRRRGGPGPVPSGPQSPRGWQVRSNAVLSLARRGSPHVQDPEIWDTLREMLDEDQQLRNFRARLSDGREVPDQTAARLTVIDAL